MKFVSEIYNKYPGSNIYVVGTGASLGVFHLLTNHINWIKSSFFFFVPGQTPKKDDFIASPI